MRTIYGFLSLFNTSVPHSSFFPNLNPSTYVLINYTSLHSGLTYLISLYSLWFSPYFFSSSLTLCSLLSFIHLTLSPLLWLSLLPISSTIGNCIVLVFLSMLQQFSTISRNFHEWVAEFFAAVFQWIPGPWYFFNPIF